MRALRAKFGLAMAGKSPWGGKSGGNGSSGGGGDGSPSGGGPKNPWLPPRGEDGERRAANIEDIFKNRGPEGPRRGGGGGFRMPERPGGKSWLPVLIVLVISLALISTMLHLIGPQERAVVKTFGNYTRTLDSGLKMSLPWPIETVDVEDVQGVRLINIPAQDEKVKLILTNDQNLVDLSYLVRFNINDLEDFKFRLAEPVETVGEVAEAAMRASVAEKTLDETFSGQGRAEIEQRVRERMQATLDEYGAGIQVLGVEIAKADPPSQVVDAFREVSVAEQEADAARNRSRGYAQQIVTEARGEAEAFDKVYAEYRLAPEVTRQRLYYETMERVLSQNDKTVIEARGVTPYLALPELRRRSQQAPATTVTPPTPVQE